MAIDFEEDDMKITILPKTQLGLWAIIMMVVSFVLLIVGLMLPYRIGYIGTDIIVQNPFQAVITVLVLAIGITGFIMALISIIKKQERSIPVFLAILLGIIYIVSLIVIMIYLFFS